MDSKKLGTCSRDAISLLPDEVLGKILSSLPTKLAASTSVLSKKWRNVFRLVHNLDFDDSVSVHPERCKEAWWYVFPESFKNFVDRTLALQCDYPIHKFSLKCRVGADNDLKKACVHRWISNVVERGVLELDLMIRGTVVHFISPQLFRSKTLVKLTLGTRLNIGKLPSDVLLPSLRSLFVDTVFFEKDDLCCVLLAGCPVLEELSVHHNDFSAIPRTISSLTIKRLSVNYDSHDAVAFWIWRIYSMSLNLPNLVYLEYSDLALVKYPQVNLESLVEAKLDFLHLVGDQLMGDLDVTGLIMGISKVEILHLSPVSVDVIYRYCSYELLVFNNLVKLSFGSMNGRGWKLLAYLLKHSPKLETLVIQDLNGYICDDVFMHLNKVKVLHILSYGGTDEELKHLKSFLWKTESLELVQVDVKEKVESIIVETKRHLMMRRGVSLPSKCQIKVI